MSPPRQAEELNEGQLNERFRDLDLSLPPAISPGQRSPRQRANSNQDLSQQGASSGGYMSPLQGGGALPSDPRAASPDSAREDESFTGQQLRQLQRRLEDIYHPDKKPGTGFRHVTSNGSLTSMSQWSDSGGEESAEKRMHKAWSSNSVSSMGGVSDHAQDPPGNVEFDLNIEEEPQRNSAKGQGRGYVADQSGKKESSPPGSPPLPRSPGNGVDRKHQQQRSLPKEYRHGHVPKNLDLAEEYKRSSDEAQGPPTTLMIRNIPNRYNQRELIVELEALGFAGTFDFLYVPLDKGTMSNVGYAFVNFVDPVNAERCMEEFQGYRFKRHRKVSGKIAAVSVAHIQGLEANLAHYKNAAVNTAKMKQRRPLVMANISQSLLKAVGGNTAPEPGGPAEGMGGLQEIQF